VIWDLAKSAVLDCFVFVVGLREAAAVTSAVVDGCRTVNCELLVDSVDVAVAAEI